MADEEAPGGDMAQLRAALIAMGGVVDHSRGELRGAPEIFVHQATGMRFPRRIGPFLRRTINRFDGEGRDVGIAYERVESGLGKSAHLSAFLSPVPQPLAAVSPDAQAGGTEALYARLKADLEGAELVEEAPHDAPLLGYRATFAATGLFDGTEQRVVEALWLYAYLGRDWVLTYRATWPDGDVEAGEDCATLIDALEWPRSFRS